MNVNNDALSPLKPRGASQPITPQKILHVGQGGCLSLAVGPAPATAR